MRSGWLFLVRIMSLHNHTKSAERTAANEARAERHSIQREAQVAAGERPGSLPRQDRKSTRLNSSHSQISYAVFCLKKKKKNTIHDVDQKDQIPYIFHGTVFMSSHIVLIPPKMLAPTKYVSTVVETAIFIHNVSAVT